MALNDVSDARIGADDVTGGGFTTELSSEEIKEHVATAHEQVEQRLAGEGFEESTLARIEMFTARHLIRFVVQGERQVDDESDPVASRTYSGAFEKQGLLATSPGQQAYSLSNGQLQTVAEFDQFFTMG